MANWDVEHIRRLTAHAADFGAILAISGDRHPSLVLLRSEMLRPDQVGPAVTSAVEIAGPELEAGALMTVDAARSRVRILPLVSRS